VVLQRKVGKAGELSGAAMQREETGDPAWGSPVLSRLRSHGEAQSEKLLEKQPLSLSTCALHPFMAWVPSGAQLWTP